MRKLKVAMLAPVHWRTPPRKQGAWELVASNITEELVKRGHDVTLFATADSITNAKLVSIVPKPLLEPAGLELEGKVYSYLHAALPFEAANQFDIIHNHFDGYPLVFSRLVNTPVVTTVHGFSSPQIKELYRKYNQSYFVSISLADRRNCPDLNWIANIYHGINLEDLPVSHQPQDYYCYLGRVHPTKGTHLAIQAAIRAGVKLKIAAHIDTNDAAAVSYWEKQCLPFVDNKQIIFNGEAGTKEKSLLLRGAVATLCPIQWEEPFGLVFIESMASGTPVIAFNRGSVPEIVKDKIGGIVVPPDDMDSFVAAMQEAKQLSRQAVRDYAESTFSIERMVDEYEKTYVKILKI